MSLGKSHLWHTCFSSSLECRCWFLLDPTYLWISPYHKIMVSSLCTCSCICFTLAIISKAPEEPGFSCWAALVLHVLQSMKFSARCYLCNSHFLSSAALISSLKNMQYIDNRKKQNHKGKAHLRNGQFWAPLELKCWECEFCREILRNPWPIAKKWYQNPWSYCSSSCHGGTLRLLRPLVMANKEPNCTYIHVCWPKRVTSREVKKHPSDFYLLHFTLRQAWHVLACH